jgi:hypothetical protein
MKDPRKPILDKGWHRARYQGGADIDLSEKSILGIYYLVQREYYVAKPEYQYVIGLEYSYCF